MTSQALHSWRIMLGATLSMAAFAAAAQTQTMRCRNDLAQSGDSKAAVLQKCGEPVAKDSFCKPVERPVDPVTQRPVPGPSVCEAVDEWTYNPGSGQFLTIVRFESGVLRSIRYGDRVK
jgi:hypothetical protein